MATKGGDCSLCHLDAFDDVEDDISACDGG